MIANKANKQAIYFYELSIKLEGSFLGFFVIYQRGYKGMSLHLGADDKNVIIKRRNHGIPSAVTTLFKLPQL